MSSEPQAARPGQDIVGRPVSRVDGVAKVTGRATYAADHDVPRMVYGVLVDATIARGRITALRTDAALAQPGVLRVISHLNAPRLAYRGFAGTLGSAPADQLRVFQDDRVAFFGQPVAVVVAESLEVAQRAARLVQVRYSTQDAALELGEGSDRLPQTYSRGDAAAAMSAAPVTVDATYRAGRNHHNPIEPHATIARWDRGELTVWDKSQWVPGTQGELAAVFGLDEARVRVISPFVGGAFGSALRTWPHVTVAALAAQVVRRPVKVVLTRRQMFFGTGHRPAYEYRVRVGSDRRGNLDAMVHHMRAETSTYETYREAVQTLGQMMYTTPNVQQTYEAVALNVNTPTYMRGPGFATAAFAVESALDELAWRLDVDPIDLRSRNEPRRDQLTGLPFSTRRLAECLRVGADRFGWADRAPRPRGRREGNWLIGTGVASAVYDTQRNQAQARVRLDVDGSVVVQAATSDMGPGTYTSMTQVAADTLGVPMSAVTFELGDSRLPMVPPHGGSQTMASVGSAVAQGCAMVRDRAVAIAVGDSESPLYRADRRQIVASGGRLSLRDDPSRTDTYRRLLHRHRRPHIEAVGVYAPPADPEYSMYAYGAQFAEVAVDESLGLVRVRRVLGVYDVGRIINPKLANSQALGGMVGGIGAALLEHTTTDVRDGRITNANFADYLVPVNADVADLEAIYLDGDDRRADPIGVKGLGEIVQVGIAPAIANAVYHATGRRPRTLPITPESFLAGEAS